MVNDPLFGVTLTLTVFAATTLLNRRTGLAILNPLLLAIGVIIAVLKAFDIPLDSYMEGGAWISFLIKPATVALAIPLYNHYDVVVRNWKSILAGILTGVITSLISVRAMAEGLGMSYEMKASLMSKSITTPIGMEVTRQLGGIVPLAISAIIFTGIFGALIAPGLCRLFGIHDKTAQGIAIGTSAHVVGTAKAIEMDEKTGAMSAVAIPIAGLITVVLAPVVMGL